MAVASSRGWVNNVRPLKVYAGRKCWAIVLIRFRVLCTAKYSRSRRSQQTVVGIEMIYVLRRHQLMLYKHSGRSGFETQEVERQSQQPFAIFFREIGHRTNKSRGFPAQFV